MAAKKLSKNALRAVISTLLMISGALALISGVILWIFKTGLIWFIPRKVMTDLHAISAIVMAVLIVVHVVLNVRMYRQEIAALKRELAKTKGKEE